MAWAVCKKIETRMTMKNLLFSLALSCLLFGENTAIAAAEIDPVLVSPRQFEVLIENEHVRVVRYRLNPGENDAWHTHPAKVSVVVSGGTLLITTADGESFEVLEESGSASWMTSLGEHFAKNVGDTPVQIVLVEVKSASTTSVECSKPD
jgi:quercetin dioxygenase-like cupin family protein